MRTKKIIRLTVAALLGLGLPAGAQDNEVAAYLPLAVGNTWTYSHDYYSLVYGEGSEEYPGMNEEGYSAYYDTIWANWETGPPFPRITIEVLRTEVIDGHTYYVISDVPENWPPAPPHFIAGKKLRWQGTHLMERTADGEKSVYRFDGATDAGYAIEPVAGDHTVAVRTSTHPVPIYDFRFRGHDIKGSARSCSFIKNYGIGLHGWAIYGIDHPVFFNDFRPLWAVLGGTRVEFEDAVTPTSTSSSSWGSVKQSFLAGENPR